MHLTNTDVACIIVAVAMHVHFVFFILTWSPCIFCKSTIDIMPGLLPLSTCVASSFLVGGDGLLPVRLLTTASLNTDKPLNAPCNGK